jgi:hypothetical protein
MSMMHLCVDVCHPTESVTCGIYGQDVSVYFVITPTLQMNIIDYDIVQMREVDGDNFHLFFGNPVTSYQFGHFVLLHPERTCGFIVNNATVNDSGQYLCIIKHFALGIGYTWRVTLQQTLQLCGR